MRVITVEDYLPQYGTIVVRDIPDEEPAPLPLLGESDLEVLTIGTIARAGDGWLRASARDVRHHVRLEAHDGPPPLDGAWLPWSSRSGGWDSVLCEDLSELGVPAPTTRPELLRFLVAAGVVIAETSGGVTRYRLPEQPPRAEDVLRLPDERRAVIRRQDARRRYTRFVADLAAVAVWSRDHTVSATPAELSGRMLATEEEIRETIAHGIEHGLLSPSGEGAFTATPRRPPESEPARQAGRSMGIS
ncbi:DUF6042 family protein [Nonomuraea aridisoli]|uniref:Uncharacterized protein n=1 Tax=Nonomuraea aridisoli TaxID=2070368 RepID=A0A2W2D186_9ACTN|nr:DUF6042 family protein [Nonomuraea aridisoli]PZG04503.1 hypothetical protein C1J01_44565 [Nonomuraea aridisoli]